MTDVTNVFNNKKYAIIKNNEVIDSILVSDENIESALSNAIALHQADESIEITGDLFWLGVGCIKDNGVWRPRKTYDGWVWGESGWQAPYPAPTDGIYQWNEYSKTWVIVPE